METIQKKDIFHLKSFPYLIRILFCPEIPGHLVQAFYFMLLISGVCFFSKNSPLCFNNFFVPKEDVTG